jgi:Protein RETICULATA-related
VHSLQEQHRSSCDAHVQALIADFMLVWLPAPSLNLSGGGGGAALKQNPVYGFFSSCPDNAFQVLQS